MFSLLITTLGTSYLYLSLLLISFESLLCLVYIFSVWFTLSCILLSRFMSSAARAAWATCTTRGGLFHFFRALFLKRALLRATTFAQFSAARDAYHLQVAGSPLGDLDDIAEAPDAHGARLLSELMQARTVGSGFSLMHCLHSALSHELLAPRKATALRHEICRSLLALSDPSVAGPAIAEKGDFFRDVRLSCGRTSLCFGPGGPFTLSFFGAVEELRRFHLLPRLISGCGSGALVAAVTALLTDRELMELSREPMRLVGPLTIRERFGLRTVGALPQLGAEEAETAKRGLEPLLCDFMWVRESGEWALASALGIAKAGWGSLLVPSEEALADLLRNQLGDETFLTAYKKTGRVVCVTVWAGAAGPRGGGHRFALSFATSPHVLLYSAVAKSCQPWTSTGGSMPLLALTESGGVEVFPLEGLPSERCATPFEAMEEPPPFFHAKRVIVLSLISPTLPVPVLTEHPARGEVDFDSLWPPLTETPASEPRSGIRDVLA